MKRKIEKGEAKGTVEAPPSKSYGHRLLICGALAEGESVIEGISQSALAASIDRYKSIDAWRDNLSMTEDSFNRLQDIIQNAGELSRRAQMSELVNNTYANKVYGEIYKK